MLSGRGRDAHAPRGIRSEAGELPRSLSFASVVVCLFFCISHEKKRDSRCDIKKNMYLCPKNKIVIQYNVNQKVIALYSNIRLSMAIEAENIQTAQAKAYINADADASGSAGVSPAANAQPTGNSGVSPAADVESNQKIISRKSAIRLAAGETPTLPEASALIAGETSSVVSTEHHCNTKESIQDYHCRKYLPHLENRGLQVITFRLYDSIPKDIVVKWKQLHANDSPIIADSEKKKLKRLIDRYEDAGYGQCFLKEEGVAEIVKNALEYYDAKRYDLIRWCIMPNHVHVLVYLYPGYSMSEVMHSWRSYSSHKANQLLARNGDFWMKEYHDRYIRDEEHLRNVIDYIDRNPVKAGLVNSPSDWPWCSAAADITKDTIADAH